MHLTTWRSLTRTAGVLALTAGAVVAGGAPARAAEPTPVAISTDPGTLTVDGSQAKYTVRVANATKGMNYTVRYDLSYVDDDVVTRVAGVPENCTAAAEVLTCTYTHTGEDGVASTPPPFKLQRKPGRSGNAGVVHLTLVKADNPIASTGAHWNSKVVVPSDGVDLVVKADDVSAIDSAGSFTGKPIPPGGTSVVVGVFGNAGDVVAKGVRVSVALPAHVTFAETEPGCVYTADKRKVICEYRDLVLAPIAVDPDPARSEDGINSIGVAYFPVKVADDAPGPVVLKGGTFAADALGVLAEKADSAALARSANQQLPKGLKAVGAAALKDADPSDNSDAFAVLVGARPGTGTLPVTGDRTGLIGGIGGSVLAAGAALYLITRRRRVLLVAPADERPIA